MRTTIIAIAISTIALACSPANADVQTQDKSANATQAKAGEEKKICKRLATSATRMVEQTCLTKSQWKAVERESR
jgi:hypothetical protein